MLFGFSSFRRVVNCDWTRAHNQLLLRHFFSQTIPALVWEIDDPLVLCELKLNLFVKIIDLNIFWKKTDYVTLTLSIRIQCTYNILLWIWMEVDIFDTINIFPEKTDDATLSICRRGSGRLLAPCLIYFHFSYSDNNITLSSWF